MKKNNKGFSLVELIIVIAIMAVLIGVLAPQFAKYIEQSRRSKDAQAASSLQTAYLADIADGTISTSVTSQTAITNTNKPSTVADTPVVSGKITDTNFYYTLDVTNGTCHIFVKIGANSYDLTTEQGVKDYKAAD
jgi:type IV pilus assembly protein PilA